MRRTSDLKFKTDTRPEAQLVLLELLRQKSQFEKLSMVCQINSTVRSLAITGIRQRHGALDDRQLHRHLADIVLGKELAQQVYGPAAKFDVTLMIDPGKEVTLAVIDVLDRLAIPYVIGGSLASSIHGTPRSTQDADILANLKSEHIADFAKALETDFYVSTEAISDAIRHRTSFNVIHFATTFKVNIFLPKNRRFDARQIENRVSCTLLENPERAAFVARPEDTILAKLDWYRQGNEISQQQWLDIQGVINVQKERLNLDYLREVGAELNVLDLLEEVLKAD